MSIYEPIESTDSRRHLQLRSPVTLERTGDGETAQLGGRELGESSGELSDRRTGASDDHRSGHAEHPLERQIGVGLSVLSGHPGLSI